MAKVAAEKKLTTQMGIQNQSREAYRLTRHYIKEGILGKISKIYVWSFKNWGYDGSPYTEKSSIPESLDWNLWLGAAPVRPFVNKVYHPGQWRKILDFGCGTLGDMGIHIFDTPFKSLDLSEPLWVEAECRAPNGFGHAEQNKVHYGFASTKYTTDNFTFTWWDGEGDRVTTATRIYNCQVATGCLSRARCSLVKPAAWSCRIVRCRPSTQTLF